MACSDLLAMLKKGAKNKRLRKKGVWWNSILLYLHARTFCFPRSLPAVYVSPLFLFLKFHQFKTNDEQQTKFEPATSPA